MNAFLSTSTHVSEAALLNALNNKGIFFVTRQKRNATYKVIERHSVARSRGLTCDQTILITGAKAEACPIRLRRIGYLDLDTGKHYVFLTNNFHLIAKTVADILQSLLADRAVL